MLMISPLGTDAADSSFKKEGRSNLSIRKYTFGGNLFRRAFSLVEVTMALGLVAFCLVAMMGMLPVGLMQARESSEQLAATQVLTAVGSDFQNSAMTGPTAQYGIANAEGDGEFFVDSSCKRTDRAADAEYHVWYKITGEAGSQAALRMHLFIARALPGDLAQRNVVVEGIVQKRLK